VIVRKLLLLFAVVAGVFAFQGTITEALPKEKVRIELVEKVQEIREQVSPGYFTPNSQEHFPVRITLQKSQILRPLLLTLLISSQQHHASL